MLTCNLYSLISASREATSLLILPLARIQASCEDGWLVGLFSLGEDIIVIEVCTECLHSSARQRWGDGSERCTVAFDGPVLEMINDWLLGKAWSGLAR